jgi:hypothetical protein
MGDRSNPIIKMTTKGGEAALYCLLVGIRMGDQCDHVGDLGNHVLTFTGPTQAGCEVNVRM